MKNITNDWFKKQNACSDGYAWVLTRQDISIRGTIDELTKINRIDWANWTIVRLLNRKKKIQYAIFAAEQVIDIYEKKYPDDKRIRLAIEAAKKCLSKNSKENRNAAYVAAHAANTTAYVAAHADITAYAAANAAYAAANAAHAAYAVTNANIAAYAVTNANIAAYAATNANIAAYAAYAKKEMQIKIINYGLALLNV